MQRNWNGQLHSLSVSLYNDTHKSYSWFLILNSPVLLLFCIWWPVWSLFSYYDFRPTQYYFFIDNTLLDYILFSNICLISIIYSRMIGLCNSAYHDRCSDMYLSPQLHVLPKTVKRKEDFSLPRGNSLWNSILLHFFFKKGNVHFFSSKFSMP